MRRWNVNRLNSPPLLWPPLRALAGWPGEPNQPDDVAEAVKAEVAEVTDEVAAESVVQVADRDGESTPLSRRPPKPISSGNNRATSRARRQPRTRSTPKLHRPRPRSRQRWLRRHTTKPSPRCPEKAAPIPDPAKPDELAVAGPGDDPAEPDGIRRQDDFSSRRRRWWRLRRRRQ